MNIFLVILTILCCKFTFAQNNYNGTSKLLTGDDICNLMEKINFKAINNIKGKEKQMKIILLSLDSNSSELKQMNIDAWYLATKKNDAFYRIWNLEYTNISKEFWDKNNKGLIMLILLDNPSLAPSSSNS